MTRKHWNDSTSPVIKTEKAAIIGSLLLVASVIAFLMSSGVGGLFFASVGIGIILLGIDNEIMHRVAVGLFGFALVLLGIGLCPLLGR